MAHGEALHVRLVDDRPIPGDVRPPLAAPGECRIDHPAFRHERRAVALVERQVLSLVADRVAEKRVVHSSSPTSCFRIGVEQQLVRVEAVPCLRLVRAMHAVAVDRARAAASGSSRARPRRYIRAARCVRSHARRWRRTGTARPGRVGGEQREVDADPSHVAPRGWGSPSLIRDRRVRRRRAPEGAPAGAISGLARCIG